MLVGYARVSTTEPTPGPAAGCTHPGRLRPCLYRYRQRCQGRTPRPCPALNYLREGDVLAVWKLDRLGRSLKDLLEIVTALEQRGIGFKSLQESMDTTTPGGKLIFHVFAALAEFERGVIRERTQAGLKAARARGRNAAAAKLSRKGMELAVTMLARSQQPHRRYLRDGRHFARHALPVRQGREGSDDVNPTRYVVPGTQTRGDSMHRRGR